MENDPKNATNFPDKETSATAPISDSSGSISEAERAAALRAGSQPVPMRTVAIGVLIIAFLGIGGGIADHFIGNAGQPSRIINSTTTTSISTGGSGSILATPKNAASSLGAQILDLKELSAQPSPSFDLRRQNGSSWSPSKARGTLLILTFYNQNCLDICPVLGNEIAQTDQLLGQNAANVTFAIVNTDPTKTSTVADPPALSVPGLNVLPNVLFLNGPLHSLNAVWKKYGIKVAVVSSSGQVAHNNALYFIGTNGNQTDLAVPFGNENSAGHYSLSARSRQQFAHALAQQITSLLS